MNRKIVGYWSEKKEKLKRVFPSLTEDDVSFREGKEKEMLEMLAYKIGKSEQELLYLIVGL